MKKVVLILSLSVFLNINTLSGYDDEDCWSCPVPSKRGSVTRIARNLKDATERRFPKKRNMENPVNNSGIDELLSNEEKEKQYWLWKKYMSTICRLMDGFYNHRDKKNRPKKGGDVYRTHFKNMNKILKKEIKKISKEDAREIELNVKTFLEFSNEPGLTCGSNKNSFFISFALDLHSNHLERFYTSFNTVNKKKGETKKGNKTIQKHIRRILFEKMGARKDASECLVGVLKKNFSKDKAIKYLKKILKIFEDFDYSIKDILYKHCYDKYDEP